MSRFLKFFEIKYAAWLCLGLAVFCRVVNTLFVSYAGRDKMLLVLQGKSFLAGNGFSIPQYFTNNLDNPVYDNTLFWPPGYSVLIAPFIKIFNGNIYWATTSLDILVCVGLILILRKICRQIGFTKAGINIMTLVAGCFEYPFTHESLPTDSVSLLFLLLGISGLLSLLIKKEFTALQILAAGFFLFLPAAFRYSYPPVSLGIPFFILVFALVRKDGVLVKKTSRLFLATAVFTLILYAFIKFYTGSAGYILETERGFFPENLIRWTPFIPASFINLSFLSSQVIRHTGVPAETLFVFLEVINSIIFFSMILYLAKCWFVNKEFNTLNPFRWFVITGTITSLLIMASLAYVSLTHKEQPRFAGSWNYIYESRYFAFVFCFIQILFLWWVFQTKRLWYKKAASVVVFAGCIILFTEVAHSLYFQTKVALNFNHYKSSVYREADYRWFDSFLSKLEDENPGVPLLVASPNDHYYPYRALYENHKGIFDPENLLQGLPEVKKNSLLVLMLYEADHEKYKDFISDTKARLINQIQFSRYYVIELTPR